MKTGVQLIEEERERQIIKLGFTGEHHFNHPEWYDKRQLTSASHMLEAYDKDDGITSVYRVLVPVNWNKEWWERLCDKPYQERLIIAGALIAAELDRLNFNKK